MAGVTPARSSTSIGRIDSAQFVGARDSFRGIKCNDPPIVGVRQKLPAVVEREFIVLALRCDYQSPRKLRLGLR